MTEETITADQFRDICRKLGLELKESTDPMNPGMLGISAYVYSPIFKFGKDSVAEYFVQDEHDTPMAQYCSHVEKDDNYGNYIVIDEGLTGLWPSARNIDDLELQLRRAIDNIKKIEDDTKWPKRQHFTVDVYYDQHKDMRFTRQDLDEEIWHFIDRLDDKLSLVTVNAGGIHNSELNVRLAVSKKIHRFGSIVKPKIGVRAWMSEYGLFFDDYED